MSLPNLTLGSEMANHLSLPLSPAPGNTIQLLASEGCLNDQAVVAAVAEALLAADVGYIQPCHSEVEIHVPPSLLLQQVLASPALAGAAPFVTHGNLRAPSVAAWCLPTHASHVLEQETVPASACQVPSVTSAVSKGRKRKAAEACTPASATRSLEHIAGTASQAVSSYLDLCTARSAGRSCEKQFGAECENVVATFEVDQPKQLRRLCQEIQHASSSGALHLLPVQQLFFLLAALHKQINLGSCSLLNEADETSGAPPAALQCLDACITALCIMAATDAPKQFLHEEYIDAVIQAIKFHLVNNALCFYSARLRQAYRPQLSSGADEPSSPSSTLKRSRSRKGSQQLCGAPQEVLQLIGRLEVAVDLVSALVAKVNVHSSALIPMIRSAAQTLTVAGIDLLQMKCVGFLVSTFKNLKGQRRTVMDELCNIIPQLPSMRCLRRIFAVDESKTVAIYGISSLILQCVQVAPELPQLDDEDSAISNCCVPAAHWADAFWDSCLKHLQAPRSLKSTEDFDCKALLEQVLVDLLLAHRHPAWPAAETLLVHAIAALGGPKGLHGSEGNVRQASVDLLGIIACQLAQDAAACELQSPAVQHLLSQAGDKDGSAALSLLLEYLADSQRSDPALVSSARQFMLCRMLASKVASQQQQQTAPEHNQQLLLQLRELSSNLNRGLRCDIRTPDAQLLARIEAQHGRLGRCRATLLSWLTEAMLSTKDMASIRAKAVKAVGAVLEADRCLLAAPKVQASIAQALQDEAVSVREAALDLLGKHITGSRELAETYFDVLVSASRDAGTSMRKRAIKVLWDSCINDLDFPRLTEACMAVLQRAADSEDSIQDLVMRVFYSLWLAPASTLGAVQADGACMKRRASQLAHVAITVYEAGGKSIHVPLEAGHAMVVVLRQALLLADKEGCQGSEEAGVALAEALLDCVLQAQETDSTTEAETTAFPYLLALHALCLANASVCLPAKDLARFARCLAPYIKVSAQAGTSELVQRRSAEQVVVILAILDTLLAAMPSLANGLAHLEADLTELINKHGFTQVVAVACRTLCCMAHVYPSAAGSLEGLCKKHSTSLQNLLDGGLDASADANKQRYACRFLFVLGHLARYGMQLLGTLGSTTLDGSLELFAQFFHSTAWGLKVQEAALQAVGMMLIANPKSMLDEEPRRIMASVLSHTAPRIFQLKALSMLTDLVKVEEARLVSGQDASADELLPGRTSHAQAGKDGSKGDEAAGLATCNGQGDSLSVSSGILQQHWDLILQLATDATALPLPAPSSNAKLSPHPPSKVQEAGSPAAALVRLRALELMEAVLHGGFVAPWTAVPHLVALATDPAREVAERAVRLLKVEGQKHVDMFQGRLVEGVVVAYEFHERLHRNTAADNPAPVGAPPEVLGSVGANLGLKAIYAAVIQNSKSVRTTFIQTLMKRFDTACCLATDGAACADLRLLAFCAHVLAALPYKRADEPLCVVAGIDSTLLKHGEVVLSQYKVSLQDKKETNVDGEAGAAAASSACIRGSAVQGKAECKASLVASMLLLVKAYLMRAYGLSCERVASFSSSAERRKQEERIATAPAAAPFPLDKLRLDAPGDVQLKYQQFKIFKALFKDELSNLHHQSTTNVSAVTPPAGCASLQTSNGLDAPHVGSDEKLTPTWAAGSIIHMDTATMGSKRSQASTKPSTRAKRTIGEVQRRGRRATCTPAGTNADSDLDDDFVVPASKGARKRLEPILYN